MSFEGFSTSSFWGLTPLHTTGFRSCEDLNYNISPTRNKVVGGLLPHKPPFGVRSCEVVLIHPKALPDPDLGEGKL